MTTAITPLSTPLPGSGMTQAAYDAAWNLFLSELPNLGIEINAVIQALNFTDTNSTSTTSLTISEGSKSLTVDPDKSYVPGMTLKIAYTSNARKWMVGEVTAYDFESGALTVYIRGFDGTTGPYESWTISLAHSELPIGQHEVSLWGGNGHGAVNTMVRRYSNVEKNIGTSITYADDEDLGASFTINDAGVYTISANDAIAAGAVTFGASLNSSQLTTAITGIDTEDVIMFGRSYDSTGNLTSFSLYLEAGDVVRPHTDGTPDQTTKFRCSFSIVRGSGGTTGPSGDQGRRSGFLYKFSTNTNVTNPDNGRFKFNSDTTATPTTALYIDTLDFSLADIEAYIASWDVGGTVIIRSANNEDLSFALLTITSKTLVTVTDAPNWYNFGVNQVAGLGASASFDNQEECVVEYYAADGSASVTTLIGQSSGPSDPSDGNSVMWTGDGTGTGDPGDVLMKINVGGIVKTVTIVDYSALPDPS